jgi:hypothetical protein
MDPLTCPRHPSAETYLRCSACDTPICLDCSNEAAVGYQCPDCASARDEAAVQASGSRTSRSSVRRGSGITPPPTTPAEGRLSPVLGLRAMAAGAAAALVGGLLMGPVLTGGFFFLITAGAIGWGVAHGVFFGTGGVTSPFVRAAALAFGGLSVAIAMATMVFWDPGGGSRGEIAFLAYPAAMYGSWITVRNRM